MNVDPPLSDAAAPSFVRVPPSSLISQKECIQ
jgi:hypothetical protein